MVEINIAADVAGVRLMLDRHRKQLLPRAERLAVNALAFDVMRAEREATKEVFKNPRPFTQKAFLVEQAKPGAPPAALVYTRPEAQKYLEPYEFGGLHVLPGKALLNPKDIRLDQYGQLRKDIMARLTARPDVFVGEVHGVKGVWQRLKVSTKGKAKGTPQRRLKLLIRFGNALPVNEHLGFATRARAIVAARFIWQFQAAFKRVGK